MSFKLRKHTNKSVYYKRVCERESLGIRGQFRDIHTRECTAYLLGVEVVEILTGFVPVGEAYRHALVIARYVLHQHVPEPAGDLLVRETTENARLVSNLGEKKKNWIFTPQTLASIQY